MFDRITAELGAPHGLVNNAGITRDALLVKVRDGGLVSKMTLEQWQAVIDVNLTGVFLCGREAAAKMIANERRGVIINIASISRAGNVGQTNYSAAKAGVHGFTMALAQEGARKGVTVNTVSPGYIGTEMVMAVPEDVRNQIIAQIPVGRLGKPEEIGRAVAFLAAEDSGFITGADMYVNGGQYMH